MLSQFALTLIAASVAEAAMASDNFSPSTRLALNTIAPAYTVGHAASPIVRVQSNDRDRCVMKCKVSYNICRDGRGRNNNNVCVQELNECLPGC